MGEFLSGITPAGGAVGLFVAVLLMVLGAMLKRLSTGDTEIRTGYSGLVGDLQKVADANLLRAERAEAQLRAVAIGRMRAREYAYGLETQLGLEHRQWTDDEDDS